MRIPGLDKIKYARVAELTKKHSNLPERYIRRCMEEITYEAPKLINYRQVVDKRIKCYFSVHRPWEYEFQLENILGKNRNKRVLVEPIKEWSIFRGDRVEILKGVDKGKQGIVCEIIQERNWVFVEGLNMYFTRTGKTKTYPGRLVQKEAPLLVTTDVALVDPGDNKPVKIQWRYDEKGNKVRVSERSGRIIPISILEEETYDYKKKSLYQENIKDTSAEEVNKITYVPALQTFEMNLMEEYGIKEDRIPAKTYWY